MYQRDEGSITKPFRIDQYSFEEEGKLKLVTKVYFQGNLLKEHITDY